MAIYISLRSSRPSARDSDALPSILLIVSTINFLQYLIEVFPCNAAITVAIKMGWPITPIVKSVVDKQVNAMLVLVPSRC